VARVVAMSCTEMFVVSSTNCTSTPDKRIVPLLVAMFGCGAWLLQDELWRRQESEHSAYHMRGAISK
jgi:hypothetical protein